MKTIPKDQWPDWVRARLGARKNVELKEAKGHLYLYGYTMAWDKEIKCPKKTSTSP